MPGRDRTWSADWERRRAGQACPMCDQGRPDDTVYGTRFHAGRYSDAYLMRSGHQPGYAVAIWRGRHVAEPTELTEREAAGYWLEVLTAGRAIEHHFRPAKMNYSIFGNELPHLHTHIEARFLTDPAPARPLYGTPKHGVDEAAFADQVASLKRIVNRGAHT